MKIIIRTIILSIAIWIVSFSGAYAGQIDCELKLKDVRSAPGRQTYCEIIFRDGRDLPAPDAPIIKGLNIKYVRAENRDQGALAHIYRIVGSKTGSYDIGPIVFNYNGNEYRSNAVTLEITDSPSPAEDRVASSERIASDMSQHIYLKLEVPKTVLFVNERIDISLDLYSDWFNLGNTSGGYIKGDDLIIDNIKDCENNMVERDKVTYLVIRRTAELTAPTPGNFTIKPVTLKFDLVNNKKDKTLFKFGSVTMDDKYNLYDKMAAINNNTEFYEKFIGPSNRKPMELSTAEVNITVIPLPKEGRPKDFSGAIGDFSFGLSASADNVTSGGKIALTMTISGPGNYSALSVPNIKKTEGIKLYPPKVVKSYRSAVYEQSIQIQSPNVKEIPEAVFSFFNPETKTYVSITRGPLPISVAAGAPGEAEEGALAEKQASKKEWIDSLKDEAGPSQRRESPFYRKESFLLFELIPIIFIFAGCVAYGIVRYLETHPLYTASIKASRRARRNMAKAASMVSGQNYKDFYGLVFNILQDYLGTRRLKPTEGITGNIVDEIDTAGIGEETIEGMRGIFRECYIAKYTHQLMGESDMKKSFEALTRIIEQLDKRAEL